MVESEKSKEERPEEGDSIYVNWVTGWTVESCTETGEGPVCKWKIAGLALGTLS